MVEHGWSLVAVDKVAIQDGRDEHLIFLRQVGGEVVFPIAAGLFEAAAVKTALERPLSPRPLTHELIFEIVKALGGCLLYGVIEALLGGVFYAKLVLRGPAGEKVEIDCRPSDAICVALDAGVPLYATPEMLDRVS